MAGNSNNFVGFEIKGLKELQERLSKLPIEAQDAGVEAANEYLVNLEKTLQPPYKYVSYKQAYGGFISDRQRRYVMARIREGSIVIPYRRTQTMRNMWRVEGKGRNQIVVNEHPAAQWLKDIQTQARMMFLRNWTVIQEDVRRNGAQILRKFEAGVSKAIRKLRLD